MSHGLTLVDLRLAIERLENSHSTCPEECGQVGALLAAAKAVLAEEPANWQRYQDNMAVMIRMTSQLFVLLAEAAVVLRRGAEREAAHQRAAGYGPGAAIAEQSELARRIEERLPRGDARERAKKSWDNWTAEDIAQELASWRNLIG